jgi:hypothetical protein
MVLKAQKHGQMATLYEKLSANENASVGMRIAFARKANWHRILARMSAEIEQPAEEEKAPDGPRSDVQSEALLFSPSRLWDARDKADLAVAEANALRRAK